jgi:hypothetical protein
LHAYNDYLRQWLLGMFEVEHSREWIRSNIKASTTPLYNDG